MQEDRLSPRRAGKLLGEATGGPPVSKETICRWVRLGKLAGVRVGGRTFIDLAALGEFLRAQNPTAVLQPLAARLRAAGRNSLAEQIFHATEGDNHENSAA